MQWTKIGICLLFLMGASCQSTKDSTDLTTPTSVTATTESVSTSLTTSSTTPSTTSTSEAPTTTVYTEPITCPSYRHPLHHLTCDEAYAATHADDKPTPRIEKTSPKLAASTSNSSLQSCIARYESENGASSDNIYQFQQGTWEAYGGTGSPGNASIVEQNAIFERAWDDGGESHWLAQKGRCF